MKLSFSTKDVDRPDFSSLCRLAGEYGLDGFEIWQTSQGLKARPMDPRYTSMVEGDASLNAFIQMDADKLGPAIAFHTFVGEVIIQGVDYSKNGNMARIEGFPWLGEGSA